MLLVLLLLLATPASAEEGFACPLPSITDGDTIRCGDVRVRLMGIDAPERDTEHGPGSTAALVGIIGRQALVCADTGERTWGRVVAICRRPDGTDIADAIVRAGWARDWPRFSGGRYEFAEREARKNGRGMWAQE